MKCLSSTIFLTWAVMSLCNPLITIDEAFFETKPQMAYVKTDGTIVIKDIE